MRLHFAERIILAGTSIAMLVVLSPVIEGLLPFASSSRADSVIRQQLKDPDSYRRNSYDLLWTGKDSQGRIARVAMVRYSATNSFGGRISECTLVAWAQQGLSVYWGSQALTSCTGDDVESNKEQLSYFLDWNGFNN